MIWEEGIAGSGIGKYRQDKVVLALAKEKTSKFSLAEAEAED